MDIGTAKPPLADRARVPHHLYDTLSPGQVFTAGEYAAAARPILDGIRRRQHLPIVCGGAGFYLRALIDGLVDAPPRDDSLRARLAARHPALLHRYLRRLDPAAARRIHANDTNKLIRAIEVCLLTRKTQTSVYEKPRPALHGFRVLKLGLDPPREALYERINARADQIFRAGLLDEVRTLLAQGYTRQAKAFESVGYKQALAHIAGEMSLDAAIAATKQKTRNYAKRQLTWFRRDGEIAWLSGFGTDETVIRPAIETVHRFLHPA
jgi:tRNA dimethylallyltransferase